MYKFKIRALAQVDVQEIVSYYDDISPKIADTFLEILYTEFETITRQPKLFQIKYRNTRVRYLKGFPYGIHYIFTEQTVSVMAVLHTDRNPEIWKER